MFNHILVPLDGSEYSERAIATARSLAEKYEAKLSLLTVMLRFPESKIHIPMLDHRSDERARQYLEEVRRTQMSTSAVPVDLVVKLGTPAESIIEFVIESQIDLIVMSTHGTTGTDSSRRSLGSTAWKILHDTPCPALLIPVHRPASQG